MKARIPVTVVNLATGKRRDYDSIASAASGIDVSYVKLKRMLKEETAYLHWYAYQSGQDDIHAERVEHLKKHFRKFGPIRNNPDALVSLRIDKHTVIMVPRYKATEKYAQKYRERLEKARK